MRGRNLGGALWLVIAAACVAEGEDVATGFGDPASAVTTAPPIPADATGTEGDSSGSSDTDDAATTSTDPSGPGSTSGDATSSDTTAAASTTGATEQPDSGMYSDCESAADCVGLNACLQGSSNPPDGYCTKTGCTDPALDCDPSPGGTAPVGCIDADVNGVPSSVCALTCNSGETCPAGMQCYPVTGASICA